MNLSVTYIPAKRWWQRDRYRLNESFTLCSIRVPPGFTSDGATTPRILWAIFPPMGKYSAAAFLHDWLLLGGTLDRKVADHKFRCGLKELGVAAWRAALMYYAVRFRSYRKEFYNVVF